MLRLAEWRSLAVPPLDLADVRTLTHQMLGDASLLAGDGYSYTDVPHEDAWYRAMAFGYPDPSLLVVARLGPTDMGTAELPE